MRNPILRWIVLILGVVFAFAALGAAGLAYLVSRIDVRAEVEQAVRNATGREMTIAGDVGVSFWPVLGLRVEEASLANVEGGRAAALATMEAINIGVEIRPLLQRDVVVRELVLRRPRIALEIDAEGAPNWLLAPAAAPAPQAPQPRPDAPPAQPRRLALHEVRAIEGEVSYFDARRGVGWIVGAANLTTALTSLDEPMRIAGEVRYAEQPVALDIEIASPRAAFAGEGTAIKLAVESPLLNADFDGASTAASGQLQGLVHVSGPNLRELASWMGTPLQGGDGLQGFAVAGRLDVSQGAYSFSNASFAFDRVQGRGDFTLSQSRGKPYLSGRLELLDFDLNPYLPGQNGQVAEAAAALEAPAAPPELPEEGAAEAASAPTAEIAVVAAPARAIDIAAAPSAAPLDFSFLRTLNADLELTTHAVLVQRMRIDRANLALVINDGFLASTLHNVTLYGGSARGRFEIDAREPATRIVQDLSVQGVDAQRFLSDAVNFAAIEGRAELQLALTMSGRTQSEMINGADGRAHIEVVSGALRGVDLGGVSRTIRNALRGELVAPEARTRFHGFSASFAIADGVLASDNLSFNTPEMRIPGVGVIDIVGQRLDLRMAARAQGGGIVAPFSARGPWTGLAYASDLRDIALREITTRVRDVQQAARAAD